MKRTPQTLEEYMSLWYETAVAKDQWGAQPCFVAFHRELPGCLAQGATWEEALANLKLARRDYIESLLEEQMPVPLPENEMMQPDWHVSDAQISVRRADPSKVPAIRVSQAA